MRNSRLFVVLTIGVLLSQPAVAMAADQASWSTGGGCSAGYYCFWYNSGSSGYWVKTTGRDSFLRNTADKYSTGRLIGKGQASDSGGSFQLTNNFNSDIVLDLCAYADYTIPVFDIGKGQSINKVEIFI
jgi:hypothetical protein